MKAHAGPHRAPGGFVPPEVTYSVRQKTWMLTEPWWCRMDSRVIRIPAGFCFDLASIPRPLWWLLAPNELGIAASAAHDWLYQHGGKITDPLPCWFTRAEADLLLRLLADNDGVWWWRRWSAWLAVRVFGILAWRSAKR